MATSTFIYAVFRCPCHAPSDYCLSVGLVFIQLKNLIC